MKYTTLELQKKKRNKTNTIPQTTLKGIHRQ